MKYIHVTGNTSTLLAIHNYWIQKKISCWNTKPWKEIN